MSGAVEYMKARNTKSSHRFKIKIWVMLTKSCILAIFLVISVILRTFCDVQCIFVSFCLDLWCTWRETCAKPLPSERTPANQHTCLSVWIYWLYIWETLLQWYWVHTHTHTQYPSAWVCLLCVYFADMFMNLQINLATHSTFLTPFIHNYIWEFLFSHFWACKTSHGISG